MQTARDENKKAEEESFSVKHKAKDLKQLLVPGMEMCDEELEHLVHEIEDYKKRMEQAERQMKSSTSAFMAAHSAWWKYLVWQEKSSIIRGLVQKVERYQMHVLYNGFWQSWSSEQTYHQLPLDSIWGYCEYLLYMLQTFIWQCNCNCICIC